MSSCGCQATGSKGVTYAEHGRPLFATAQPGRAYVGETQFTDAPEGPSSFQPGTRLPAGSPDSLGSDFEEADSVPGLLLGKATWTPVGGGPEEALISES